MRCCLLISGGFPGGVCGVLFVGLVVALGAVCVWFCWVWFGFGFGSRLVALYLWFEFCVLFGGMLVGLFAYLMRCCLSWWFGLGLCVVYAGVVVVFGWFGFWAGVSVGWCCHWLGLGFGGFEVNLVVWCNMYACVRKLRVLWGGCGWIMRFGFCMVF